GDDLAPGGRRGAAAGQGRGGAAALLLLADAIQALLKLVLLRHGRLSLPALSPALAKPIGRNLGALAARCPAYNGRNGENRGSLGENRSSAAGRRSRDGANRQRRARDALFRFPGDCRGS